MGAHRIRTTINPGETLTVGDAELLDLTRQGLVAKDKKTAEAILAEAETTEEEGK